MRILHLTISFAIGGRRRAVTTLIEHLRVVGVECDLGCVEELGCAEKEVERLVGAFTVLKRRSVTDFRALRQLTDFCDSRAIQIIHAHDAASQFIGAMLRLRRPQVRLLMTFHRTVATETARHRDRLRNAFAASRCGAIVTGSQERRQHYLNANYVPASKVIRIPFGIDGRRFRPAPERRAALRKELGLAPETVVLGAIGHFGHLKGMDIVIRGYQTLLRRQPDRAPVLILAGDGSPEQRAEIQSLAETVTNGRIFFVGYRQDIENWFQAFDIFVHAPRMEAYGLVLAEAMMVGLPVVATRVGGIPDLVREGRTGFLVESEAPRAVADALERLLADSARRQAMGQTARQFALAEFGGELYARRHLRLYEDLLAGRLPVGADEPATNGSLQHDAFETIPNKTPTDQPG